jgi:hypothetical protein
MTISQRYSKMNNLSCAKTVLMICWIDFLQP